MRRGSRLGTAGRHGAQTTPCTRCAHSAFGRPYPQIFGCLYVSHRVATSCRRRAEIYPSRNGPAPNPVRDFRIRTIQFFIYLINPLLQSDLDTRYRLEALNPMSWSSRDGSETQSVTRLKRPLREHVAGSRVTSWQPGFGRGLQCTTSPCGLHRHRAVARSRWSGCAAQATSGAAREVRAREARE